MSFPGRKILSLENIYGMALTLHSPTASPFLFGSSKSIELCRSLERTSQYPRHTPSSPCQTRLFTSFYHRAGQGPGPGQRSPGLINLRSKYVTFGIPPTATGNHCKPGAAWQVTQTVLLVLVLRTGNGNIINNDNNNVGSAAVSAALSHKYGTTAAAEESGAHGAQHIVLMYVDARGLGRRVIVKQMAKSWINAAARRRRALE